MRATQTVGGGATLPSHPQTSECLTEYAEVAKGVLFEARFSCPKFLNLLQIKNVKKRRRTLPAEGRK